MKAKNKKVDPITIFEALRTRESIALFILVKNNGSKNNTERLMELTGLTRKSYYSRMSALARAGLIKKNGSEYKLSIFGKIIGSIFNDITKATDNYWPIKALESVLDDPHLPNKELDEITKKMFTDDDLRSEIKIILGLP